MSDMNFEDFTKIFESWQFDLRPFLMNPSEWAEEPEGLLYHYTTPEGLLGILESGSIRATHVRYLNDRNELKNALSPEYMRLLSDLLLPEADEVRKGRLGNVNRFQRDEQVFVASFTDDGAVREGEDIKPGNRLSQWRAYSNQAGGFSLGFDSRKLKLATWQSTRELGMDGPFFSRCRYGASEKREAVERIGKWGAEITPRYYESRLNHFQRVVGREPDCDDLKLIELGSDSCALGAMDAHYFASEAARFKDEAFAEEREWRIAIRANRGKLLESHLSRPKSPIIRFRAGRHGVTPFIEIPLLLNSAESPLQRVVVGPSQNEEEAVEGVKLLLQAKGIKLRAPDSDDGVEVAPSGVPYRG